MSEWYLIILLAVLGLIASCLLLYPLKKQPKLCALFLPLMLGFLYLAYGLWGGFIPWKKQIEKQLAHKQARQLLKQFKNPQELIAQLKERLDDRVESAKGWFLLGRIYSNQNQESQALQAFAKAYRLKPQEEEFAVHYAHSLWRNNHQQFNEEILSLLEALLKQNPRQPDALALLALQAYSSEDFQKAIGYWQSLLALVPKQSKEALAIQKAIEKAIEQAG